MVRDGKEVVSEEREVKEVISEVKRR